MAGESRQSASDGQRQAAARRAADAGHSLPAGSGVEPICTVSAVASALHILRHLASSERPQTVTQLARDLHVNPSTCFNILRTLVAEDAVVFSPSSKAYAVGRGVAEIASGLYRGGLDMAALQRPLNSFAWEHDLTVTLWRRFGERLVLAAVAEGGGDHVIRMRLGQRVPVLLGANGRCIAAFGGLHPDALPGLFERVTWARPPSLQSYLRQVRETARRGWARDDGQYAASLTSLSAPLRPAEGPVAATVGATMFAGHYDGTAVGHIGEALVSLGRELSALMTAPAAADRPPGRVGRHPLPAGPIPT